MYPEAGDVPFLKVYNVTMDGRVDFSIKPTFVDTTTNENQLARSRVRPGDVLMNIVGTPPLGKVAIVPDAHPEWNINQAIVAFRPKSSLNSRFLAHCLMSDAVCGPCCARVRNGRSNESLAIELPPIVASDSAGNRARADLPGDRATSLGIHQYYQRTNNRCEPFIVVAGARNSSSARLAEDCLQVLTVAFRLSQRQWPCHERLQRRAPLR